MRWAGRVAAKHVLYMLIKSHEVSDPEEKYMELCGAIRAGEQRLWWYRIMKSYCEDYKDGAIVGYDEPLPDIGLRGLKETDHGYTFFKKADTQYIGRAACNCNEVRALAEGIP